MLQALNQVVTLVKKTYKHKGVIPTIVGGLRGIAFYIGTIAVYVVCKLFKRHSVFEFNGDQLPYFYHPYHVTWMNERTIEIPIVQELIRNPDRVLEVGNVLSHYMPIRHEVLDKYEEVPGVINQDVIDFKPNGLYDLIISISTLEHVGWDEHPRDPSKVIRAVEHLINLLAPAGTLIVTMPLGYNPHLDAFIEQGKFAFSETFYLKRVSVLNDWIQVDWNSVRGTKYGQPYSAANAMVIGIVRKP